jgi:hypothetical protein
MYLEILFQILLPVIGATAICLYFVSRGKFNMELTPLVSLLAFIITASFYFIPLFNYGVLGMKDYMYIKNNMSETDFKEFKKTSKELEYLGVKMMLARQIIDNIDEKKIERDIKRISNYKVKKDREEETLKLLYTDDDGNISFDEIMSKEDFGKFNRAMLELERRAKKYLIEE